MLFLFGFGQSSSFSNGCLLCVVLSDGASAGAGRTPHGISPTELAGRTELCTADGPGTDSYIQ